MLTLQSERAFMQQAQQQLAQDILMCSEPLHEQHSVTYRSAKAQGFDGQWVQASAHQPQQLDCGEDGSCEHSKEPES